MDNMSNMASSMSMSDMATATATSAAAASSTTSSMDMDMDMGSSDCKMSMLWNWYTVDACFISSNWHITSKGMFAGSMIGVILLVMLLEFVRRTAKEYDRLLLRQHQRAAFASLATAKSSSYCSGAPSDTDQPQHEPKSGAGVLASPSGSPFAVGGVGRTRTRFRPNLLQQLVRALFHMLQFAIAYFIMLLAMYYNGYVIICIFIGAFLGAFVFGWESVEVDV